MLDIIYIALTLAVFALVALAASGLERMGPRAKASARSESAGEERS
ncbi:hypothetical protein [Streptomyces sp. AC495_CC817]|nr:hypothetical protein [Streptomyces sp. AC495_CC817]